MLFRALPFALLTVVLGVLVTMEFRSVSALTLDDVSLLIQQEGLDAGFAQVRKEYKTNPAFRGDCHRFMLNVGERAFKEFPEIETAVYSPLSVTCNYGFFQAYPHALLLATKDVARAEAYCLRVGDALKEQVPSAQAECFRGMGRALPFIEEVSLGNVEMMAMSALRACDAVATSTPASPGLESDHDLCVSGTFNMLGRAVAERQYGLEVNSAQPFGVCELPQVPDTKLRCYGNFKWSLLNGLNVSNPVEAFETARKAEDFPAALGSMVWSIGYEYARTNLGFKDVYARTLEACRALPEEWRVDCVHGGAIAFAKHGTPSKQHVEVIAYCSAARETGIHPAECLYQQVVQYIQGFYSNEKFKSACDAFRRELGVRCDLKN